MEESKKNNDEKLVFKNQYLNELAKRNPKLKSAETFHEEFPDFINKREELKSDEFFSTYKMQSDFDKKYYVLKVFNQNLLETENIKVKGTNKDGKEVLILKENDIIRGQIKDMLISLELSSNNLLECKSLYEIDYEQQNEKQQTEKVELIICKSEFIEGGNLLQNIKIRKENNNNFKAQEIIAMIKGLIDALTKMQHQQAPPDYNQQFMIKEDSARGINHLNINLLNILLRKELGQETAVLSDFSLGRYRKLCLGSDTMHDQIPKEAYASNYRSAQYLKIINEYKSNGQPKNCIFDPQKNDIYSIGVCMLMASTGLDEPEQLNDLNIGNQDGKRKDQNKYESFLKQIPDKQLAEIIMQMTAFDQDNRCDLLELQQLLDNYTYE